MIGRSVDAGGAVGGAAVDADVEVVGVAVVARRLHHRLFGACEQDCGGAAAAAFAQEARFEVGGDEDELHAGVAVGDELGYELPVTGVIETVDLVGFDALARFVEFGEGEGFDGSTFCVEHVEGDIDVAAILVGAMAVDAAALLLGELADG